jgi:hypothetical protein
MLPRKKSNVTKKVPNITTRSAQKNVDEIIKFKFFIDIFFYFRFFLPNSVFRFFTVLENRSKLQS